MEKRIVESFVVLLDGTIGVGKKTLGGHLAQRFAGTYLDGDDYKVKGQPWYCSSLTTCRLLRRATNEALKDATIVFVGRPTRCLDWIYFTKHFEQRGTRIFLIGLQASFENITNESRGRIFSQEERDRMVEMIHEGYGARACSDVHIRTDHAGIGATVDKLEAAINDLIQAAS